jgi:dTDP-4-amino-4,6-dideoxygalactose transaminase
LRDWGQAERYTHVMKGFNNRMEAIQGAVLAVKLRHLESWIAARQRAAATYDALLSNTAVGRPAAADERDHVWHVYAVRVRDRDEVRQALGRAGISTGMHYPVPVHLQPAYADLSYRRGDFPISEKLADETLSLPLCPELTRLQAQAFGSNMSKPSRSVVAW